MIIWQADAHTHTHTGTYYLTRNDQVEALNIEAAEFVDDILFDRRYSLLEQMENQVDTIRDDYAQQEVDKNDLLQSFQACVILQD